MGESLRTAFVTGAAGLVGGAVAESLVRDGYRVVCLGHSERVLDHRPTLKAAVWVRGSVADLPLMRDVIARYEPEEVYHYAASALVRGAVRDPAGAVLTNTFGTAAVLEACRIVGGVKAALIAGTDKEYGNVLRATEDTPLRPEHVYDASKASSDLIAQAYARDYSLPIVITRACNIFGPGDMHWSRIVPRTCRELATGGRPVIFEQALRMRREFLYVNDYVAAARWLVSGLRDKVFFGADRFTVSPGAIFNVGSGHVYTVADVVKLITAASGRNVEPEVQPRDGAFDELLEQSLDCTKLRNLGWRPASDIVEALTDTYRWYQGFLTGEA